MMRAQHPLRAEVTPPRPVGQRDRRCNRSEWLTWGLRRSEGVIGLRSRQDCGVERDCFAVIEVELVVCRGAVDNIAIENEPQLVGSAPDLLGVCEVPGEHRVCVYSAVRTNPILITHLGVLA